MAVLLSLAAFSSGAAALLFEALWLRRAGVMLGSTVWASSIVLASFMTGLALGNGLAARWAARWRRPLRVYAALELAVGLAATVAVLVAPALPAVLAPLFRALAGVAGLTNLVRLVVAFALMLPATTAMGMTLPFLTRVVSRDEEDFGRVLGYLYGANTLGGALGAVAGELWLVAPLGLRGAAACAAGANLLAAGVAWWLARRPPAAAESGAGSPAPRTRLDARSWRWLAAAFLAGAAMLGLEVVWFRFLQLFLFGTALTFAFMLAVILVGIGLGGVFASLWLRRDPGAHRWLSAVAALGAWAALLGYAAFSPWLGGAAFFISRPDATLALSLRLMLPASLVSGALFTLQGAALRQHFPGAAETAGRLLLANTLGAVGGALVGGFVLLPVLGMERSLCAVVLVYGAVAALCGGHGAGRPARRGRIVWLGSLVAVALALLVFPRGAMTNRHLPTSLSRFLGEGIRLVALREGQNQTTAYLRREWGGQPVAYRLVTNGHSMSGTELPDRRYMKTFVYWPIAVRPRIRSALLISYGVGSTAKALTDTRALTRIHVVDISREILEMSSVVFPPGQDPLADPRVRVHVEDGRFFLQTTGESFDLITGEPPPPKAAGVVSLYSREYFRLLHDRLNQQGVATYWLPVEELDEDDARAIVKAFCSAFADCSLWTGAGAHWMLAGTRGPRAGATEEDFTTQWRDPVVGPELARLGLEQPEQLGTTFLADAEQLAGWIAAAAPLEDDHPQRLSPARPHPARQGFIDRWMAKEQAGARFEQSRWVAGWWPPGLRERTRGYFATQRLVNAVMFLPRRWPGLEALRDVLLDSRLRTLPLLLAGSDPLVQEISGRAWAAGERSPALEEQQAMGALAARDYAAAAEHFAAAAGPGGSQALDARLYQAFALVMAQSPEEARAVLATVGPAPAASADQRAAMHWLGAMVEITAECGR
jgi:predicted membrane-bound spermidine synthase